MLSSNQLSELAKKLHTSESVVFREYMQLVFLENLYATSGSDQIIFKGGTAVHLMYEAPRFSEDLDFTVLMEPDTFKAFIAKVFKSVLLSNEITFKERKTITGRRYLLTATPEILKSSAFINLDFSFREKVTLIDKKPLVTQYPITVTSPIYFMGKDEIIAEKIRAILTRKKGRDLYDLWFLLLNNGKINKDLVKLKLDYYGDKNVSFEDLRNKIQNFPYKLYSDDLRPFVTYKAREVLERDFANMKEYLLDGRLLV